MTSVLSYLVLPAEQTDFEDQHLDRMNRVALAFFWCNLPLFATVAWWNETGLLSALLLTALTLFGSTVSTLMWPSARRTSVIHGITAMCMGGLLVHFGQGPMQIEMHFYFFSLLAVLAIFGNPTVILAAAVTVTLHHTVIFALIPDSVFNYDASLWVVAVHATFVVIESAAAVFLARSYFDNVIGLERIVAARTAELDTANQAMRLVLENVGDGLVTVDRDGVIGTERSAKAREWLGEDGGGTPLSERVRALDPAAAEWLELGWQDLTDGYMPLAVTLDQLPKRIVRGEQHLKMSYIPIGEGDGEAGSFNGMLVVMSDISAELARGEAEADQKQLLALIQQMNDDRSGFQAFYQDGGELMELLATPEVHEEASVLRWLHTLKGNALSYKMDRLGGAVHDLETALLEEHRQMNRADAEALAIHWDAIQQGMLLVTGQQDDGFLRVPSEKAAALERAVENERDPAEILGLLRSIAYQPAAHRLKSLAQQASRIADRVGLPQVDVVIDDNEVFIPPAAWSPFWSSVIHVVRNALDHGIEDAEERLAKGKSAVGTLSLATRVVDNCIEVSIADDGRGIDWNALCAKAKELGLPSETDEDLLEALFYNGLSTREQATELSGRGVGMSAVRVAAVECGGTVHVQSVPDQGTTIAFRFPKAELRSAAA